MNVELRILVFEDRVADAEQIKKELRKSELAFSLSRVEGKNDFLNELEGNPPDLILFDQGLPGFDGLTALALARQRCPNTPFIFILRNPSEEFVFETLKGGATDHIVKDRLSDLIPTVQRAMRAAEERAERKRIEDKLRRATEQLRALTAYLESVREQERARIAAETRGELKANLTALRADLDWMAQRLAVQSRPLSDKSRSMFAQVDQALSYLQDLATSIFPRVLEERGLTAAIQWQVEQFQSQTGVSCHLSSQLKKACLPQKLSAACFRIFQEALTNIACHANATSVEIRVYEERNALVLEVKDNGRGIAHHEIDGPNSFGLMGMRERAALLGGEFSIQGRPAKGTTLTVKIPYRMSLVGT